MRQENTSGFRRGIVVPGKAGGVSSNAGIVTIPKEYAVGDERSQGRRGPAKTEVIDRRCLRAFTPQIALSVPRVSLLFVADAGQPASEEGSRC